MTGPILSYKAAEPRKAHSRLGVVSCLLAVFVSLKQQLPTPVSSSTPAVYAMVVVNTLLAAPVAGLALGIAGICLRSRQRVFAVMGVGLNGAILLTYVAMGIAFVISYR